MKAYMDTGMRHDKSGIIEKDGSWMGQTHRIAGPDP